MQLNKSGIASLAFGIILLLATLTIGFGGNAVALVTSGLVMGGIAWAGVLLVVLGILILVI